MVKHITRALKLTILFTTMSEHTMSFLLPTILIYYLENLLHISAASNSGFTEISYFLGILEGSYGFCSLIGGSFWGAVSDKIGRKLSLIILLSGISLSSIGLGLACTFEVALFWRMVAGLFAGLIPTTKALILDMTDDSNVGVLYSYFGAGYGASSILGPFLGGFLTAPSGLVPDFMEKIVLDRFPYCLPLVMHALLALGTLMLVVFTIPDRKSLERSEKMRISFLKSRDYLGCVFVLFLSIFLQYSYRTLMGFWLRLEVNSGGMGWITSRNPGIMKMASGAISMIIPLLFTDLIKSQFGIKTSIFCLSLTVIIPNSGVSFSNLLSGSSMWILLITCNGLSIAFCTVSLSIISIAISNVVDSEVAGTAIGVSQTVAALGKAVATSGTAVMFGWLRGFELNFPFDSHLMFFLNNGVSLGVALAVVLLVGKRTEKREKSEMEESFLKDIEE